MADVSLELLAANQRKMMEKMEDLDEIKAMLRLLRDMIEIGKQERDILGTRVHRTERRVSRLEDMADDGV